MTNATVVLQPVILHNQSIIDQVKFAANLAADQVRGVLPIHVMGKFIQRFELYCIESELRGSVQQPASSCIFIEEIVFQGI